jgi:hypothetical protein
MKSEFIFAPVSYAALKIQKQVCAGWNLGSSITYHPTSLTFQVNCQQPITQEKITQVGEKQQSSAF